jgi:prepilin-type N-terminal cleavage/methylation domain-containing protein
MATAQVGKPMKPQRPNAFTLVELLTVMALAAVLMGIGITVLPGVMKSSQISTAGRQVYATLNMARQMAIAQRTQVQVVVTNFVATGIGIGSVTNAAYAVLTNAPPSSATWIVAGRWEYLPSGLIFSNLTPSVRSDYVRFDQTRAATPRNNIANWSVMIFDATTPSHNNWVNIRVDPLLGRISMERP